MYAKAWNNCETTIGDKENKDKYYKSPMKCKEGKLNEGIKPLE